MISTREAKFPEDAEQIARIDASFTTDTVYIAHHHGDEMILQSFTLVAPVTKRIPLQELNKLDIPWEFATVATVDNRICGFLAAGYQVWNRRPTIWHLCVDSLHRRHGIARRLIDRAQIYGIAKGALNMWLEASSLNTPGVQVYRCLRFALRGLDTTLYQGTLIPDESALFLRAQYPVASPEPW